MTTHPSNSATPEPDRSLEALQYERDQARASATRWRRLYEVEAQQRQKEAEIAEQTIQSLRAEIQQLCQFPANIGMPNAASTSRKSLSSPDSVPQMKNQIADLMAERDQLLQALEQERQNHDKTRDNLISALDDALGAQRKKSLALPSSKAGARASAIIHKDRDNRKKRSDR